MTTQPKISVIIPCYNAEAFLQQSIESVLAQQYDNLELIIVNDGSTDNSAAILDHYASSYPGKIYVEHSPNRGVSAARNLGTNIATGEYIQYLDADDLLRPETLQKRIQTLQSSGADVVYANFQLIMEQKDGTYTYGKIVNRQIKDVHPIPEISLFTNFWVPLAALMYKKTIVDKIGSWNETLPIIQDARFALDAALHGATFEYINSVEAYYRVSLGNSLSRRDPLGFYVDCYNNALQIEQYWEKNGGLTHERLKALAHVYNFTSKSLFWHDEQLFLKNIQHLRRVQFRPALSFARLIHVISQLIGINQTRNILAILKRIKSLCKKLSDSLKFNIADSLVEPFEFEPL